MTTSSGTWHQCGRPEIIATDTGASFVASDSIERVIDLGSALQYAAVKCAELRGIIERWFGTLNRTLTPRLPGHTHSDLPLNFHPTATGARFLFTPVGAG